MPTPSFFIEVLYNVVVCYTWTYPYPQYVQYVWVRDNTQVVNTRTKKREIVVGT